MTTADDILACLDKYGPPVPSLLPWVARWAAEGDLLGIARVAAVHKALAAPTRWPAVADAVAETLAKRTREQPLLMWQVADVLPQIAAHLEPDQVTAMTRFGVRADAQAYAALSSSDAIGEAVLRLIDPLWREIFVGARPNAVPPLSNLRLLARLARAGHEAPTNLLDSDVVYLLPYLSTEHADAAWGDRAVAEIEDWLGEATPWYSAALLTRAVPWLNDRQRTRLTDRAGTAIRGGANSDWATLFAELCREVRSPWPSPAMELAAAHPVTGHLDELAEKAAGTDLAGACAKITSRMVASHADMALQGWESALPGVEPESGAEQVPMVIQPEWEGPGQVTLSVADGQVGSGERIQLPGASTRYRLLEFVCPRCPRPQYRIYYDEANLPTCAHGRMELRR